MRRLFSQSINMSHMISRRVAQAKDSVNTGLTQNNNSCTVKKELDLESSCDTAIPDMILDPDKLLHNTRNKEFISTDLVSPLMYDRLLDVHKQENTEEILNYDDVATQDVKQQSGHSDTKSFLNGDPCKSSLVDFETCDSETLLNDDACHVKGDNCTHDYSNELKQLVFGDFENSLVSKGLVHNKEKFSGLEEDKEGNIEPGLSTIHEKSEYNSSHIEEDIDLKPDVKISVKIEVDEEITMNDDSCCCSIDVSQSCTCQRVDYSTKENKYVIIKGDESVIIKENKHVVIKEYESVIIKKDESWTPGYQQECTYPSNLESQKSHEKDRPYQCSESFKTKHNLNTHNSRLHQDRPLKCSKCMKGFIVKSDLLIHEKGHLEIRQYQCLDCMQKFKSKRRLSSHIRLIHNERPFKCSKCIKGFITQSTLLIHEKRHLEIRPYQCQQCSMAFKTKDDLTSHMFTHEEGRPYQCSECIQKFKTKNVLITHIRIIHNERPFKCSKCIQGFIKPSMLLIHEKRHLEIRPYQCPQCSMAFKTKNGLTSHMFTHGEGRQYKCSECMKSFISKSKLVLHERQHSGIRPYLCQECPKTYYSNQGLKEHQRTHTRVHQCEECPQKFLKKIELRKHKQSHDEPKQSYKCPECYQSFPSRSILTRHTQKHISQNFLSVLGH